MPTKWAKMRGRSGRLWVFEASYSFGTSKNGILIKKHFLWIFAYFSPKGQDKRKFRASALLGHARLSDSHFNSILQLLIDCGVAVLTRDSDGYDALDVLRRCSYPEHSSVIQFLMRQWSDFFYCPFYNLFTNFLNTKIVHQLK